MNKIKKKQSIPRYKEENSRTCFLKFQRDFILFFKRQRASKNNH